MMYDIILYYILFIAAILILVSCSKGTKRNKANKKLEDRVNNLKQ
jgi:hypothetical protein